MRHATSTLFSLFTCAFAIVAQANAQNVDLQKFATSVLDRMRSPGALGQRSQLAPKAKVSILGTTETKEPRTQIIYFAVEDGGPADGWYIATCPALIEGGWICSYNQIILPAFTMK